MALSPISVELREHHKNIVICADAVSRNRHTTKESIRTSDAIEDANGDDRRNRPEDIPEEQVRVLKDVLRTPSAVDHEPPEDADTDDVLVEKVDNPGGKSRQISEGSMERRRPENIHIAVASV